MEQEILHQIGQVTDMLSQLKEPISRSSPTELDAEAQNAISGLLQEVETYHLAYRPMPASSPSLSFPASLPDYEAGSSVVPVSSPFIAMGSSEVPVPQDIQTICPWCRKKLTVIVLLK